MARGIVVLFHLFVFRQFDVGSVLERFLGVLLAVTTVDSRPMTTILWPWTGSLLASILVTRNVPGPYSLVVDGTIIGVFWVRKIL
jgi:hypothetical protein